MKIPGWFPSTKNDVRQIMATQAELKEELRITQESLDKEQEQLKAARQLLEDINAQQKEIIERLEQDDVDDEIIEMVRAMRTDIEGTIEDAPPPVE